MSPLFYRTMTAAELPGLADHRSLRGGSCRLRIPRRRSRSDQRALGYPRLLQAGRRRPHARAAGRLLPAPPCRRRHLIGAFDGETLVGVGLLTPEIRPGLAQLAYLYVSAPHRREGVASSITRRLLELARKLGSRSVYVSATPSQLRSSSTGASDSFPRRSRSRSCTLRSLPTSHGPAGGPGPARAAGEP